jgi:hypothetical protein
VGENHHYHTIYGEFHSLDQWPAITCVGKRSRHSKMLGDPNGNCHYGEGQSLEVVWSQCRNDSRPPATGISVNVKQRIRLLPDTIRTIE